MTKFEKARIIISTIYGMNYVCTENNKLQWKQAKQAAREDVESVNLRYLQCLEVLQERSGKDNRDYIAEFVAQVENRV